jgi:hypothetical protein
VQSRKNLEADGRRGTAENGGVEPKRATASVAVCQVRAVVDTPVQAQGEVHIRSALDIRAGVRMQVAAHNPEPRSANTCGPMDRDGNPADKDMARTGSA